MSNFDLDSLFQEVQSEEVTRAAEKNSSTSYVKFSEDERFIQFKAGNTFTFRLLYYVEDPIKRKRPFIERYNHGYWDDNAEFNKLKEVTCPTSEYLMANNGFNKCPVCKATRKFYKDGKDGSQTADELYSQFRRKFHGYALVYVVNDPINEDNNGQIKIMHFGITLEKWFKLQIFGIDEKGNTVDSETIGLDAFKPKEGFNLKIAVTKKGEYNNYTPEFVRKATSIDIDQSDIAEAAAELKFDEEFLTSTTAEELDEFYKTYVLSEEVAKDSSDELDLSEELEEEVEKEEVEISTKPKKAAKKKEESVVEDEPEEDLNDDSGSIDIDAILAKAKKAK